MKIVAIDGPAGSGKSTVARRLAEELELAYLDTGAMYRAAAYAVLRRGIDPSDAAKVAEVAAAAHITLEQGQVLVDGEDATAAIRGPEVTRAVSAVAANPDVRREMVARQRAWVDEHGGGVVEGRDIGTVVFPDADLKVFLTARLDVRAARRHREVAGAHGEIDAVQADMVRRDGVDAGREVAPMQAASDAAMIDTSDLGTEEVVAEVLRRLKR